MHKKFEINFYIGEDIGVSVVAEAGKEIVFRTSSTLTGNELSAAFVIKELLSCLSSGKSIDMHFSPYDTSEDDRIMLKCRWERSGNLTVMAEDVQEKFNFSVNVQEALAKVRIFTCSRATFKKMPPRRTAAVVSRKRS